MAVVAAVVASMSMPESAEVDRWSRSSSSVG